jgi:hypothetical protein
LVKANNQEISHLRWIYKRKVPANLKMKRENKVDLKSDRKVKLKKI